MTAVPPRGSGEEGAARGRPPLGELADEELVLLAQRAAPGDHAAFTELFRRYQRHVLTNCRYLSDPSRAEDLAQEVFVKVYFGLPRFERRAAFRTWLDRVKANHCVNQGMKEALRRRHRAPLEAAANAAVAPEQERIPDRVEASRSVEEALAGLSPTLRVPLVLADMDGLPAAEVASLLGIGLSAAKMRIKRGREAFRARFRGEAP